MDYEMRITRVHVLPKGEPIFSQKAWIVQIEDESGGEFIVVQEQMGFPDKETIRINPNEWPALKNAVEYMFSQCRSEDDFEGIADEVEPAIEAANPSCVDMLGRDVREGDVLWNVKGLSLHSHDRQVRHLTSVRCPRPGEAVPEFEGWQKMCEAMQNAGARFDVKVDGTHSGGPLMFDGIAIEYRRTTNCKWKL